MNNENITDFDAEEFMKSGGGYINRGSEKEIAVMEYVNSESMVFFESFSDAMREFIERATSNGWSSEAINGVVWREKIGVIFYIEDGMPLHYIIPGTDERAVASMGRMAVTTNPIIVKKTTPAHNYLGALEKLGAELKRIEAEKKSKEKK